MTALAAIPWPAWTVIGAVTLWLLNALLRGPLSDLGRSLAQGASSVARARGILGRRARRKYLFALADAHWRVELPFERARLNLRWIYVPQQLSRPDESHRAEALRFVASDPRMVVIGPPGAGKSLLLRYLELRIAAAQVRVGEFAERSRLIGEDSSSRNRLLRAWQVLVEMRRPTRQLEEAEERRLLRQTVPILVPLRRLARHSGGVESFLTASLAEMHVRRPAEMLARWNRSGRLLLLFDGLDEVPRADRVRLLDELTPWLDANPRVRSVTTCRSMVYERDHRTLPGAAHELTEFDGERIETFLRRYRESQDRAYGERVRRIAGSAERNDAKLLYVGPRMEPRKPPGRIYDELRRRERIFALMANPLLLTIAAHLFETNPNFTLPHSRAGFYDLACDVLLESWQPELNQFASEDRHALLCAVALWSQTRPKDDAGAGWDIAEPGAFSKEQMIAASAEVLGRRGRNAADAAAMITEITERSGLLLRLGAPESYTFTHPTLREFFAASAYVKEGRALARLYAEDQSTWEEPVRLWCGLVPDASRMVDAVAAYDLATALWCAVEARSVSDECLVGLAQQSLAALRDSQHRREVRLALAGLLGVHERGDAIFDTLAGADVELDAELEDRRRRRAAEARRRDVAARERREREQLAHLRAQRLLDARRHVAEQRSASAPAFGDPERPFDDTAVSALFRFASLGDVWSIDALARIPTEFAADALVRCLELGDLNAAREAAHRLASLTAARQHQLSGRGCVPTATRDLTWVWRPFGSPDSRIGRIAGAIAFHLPSLLDDQTVDLISPPLDPRLLVPVCAFGAPRFDALLAAAPDQEIERLTAIATRLTMTTPWVRLADRRQLVTLLSQLPHPADRPLPPAEAAAAGEALMRIARSSDPGWTRGLEALPAEVRSQLAPRLLWAHARGRALTTRDWTAFQSARRYDFDRSRSFEAAAGFCLVLASGALVTIASTSSSGTLELAALPSAAVLAVAWLRLLLRVRTTDSESDLLLHVVVGPVFRGWSRRSREAQQRGTQFERVRFAVAGAMAAFVAPCALVWCGVGVSQVAPLPAAIVTPLLALGVIVTLWRHGRRLADRAENPLRGLVLEPTA